MGAATTARTARPNADEIVVGKHESPCTSASFVVVVALVFAP